LHNFPWFCADDRCVQGQRKISCGSEAGLHCQAKITRRERGKQTSCECLVRGTNRWNIMAEQRCFRRSHGVQIKPARGKLHGAAACVERMLDVTARCWITAARRSVERPIRMGGQGEPLGTRLRRKKRPVILSQTRDRIRRDAQNCQLKARGRIGGTT
jgi:hypothetical protein